MKVKSESEVAHSCPTPSNPIDCSPLGPSIHGIFQARVLEWGAIAFSLYLPKRKERMCPYKVWYLIQNNFINNLFTTDILIRLLLPQCYRLVCFNSHLHNKLLATGINFCKNLSVNNVFSSVQSLSRVWLFATPWIAARQASLSITNSRSSLKLTSIESVMPSNHLILCRPLLLLPPIPPRISLFQWVNSSREVAQELGVSALASVLPMNTQDWSPLGWTDWISLQSKGLSRVFCNTTVQKHQFSGAWLSL